MKATRLRRRRPANTLPTGSRRVWSAWSTMRAATTRSVKMRCRGMRCLFYRIIPSLVSVRVNAFWQSFRIVSILELSRFFVQAHRQTLFVRFYRASLNVRNFTVTQRTPARGIVNLTLAAQKSLLQVGGRYHVQGVSSAGVGCKAPCKPRI